MFSSKYCKIFKSIFFIEHPWWLLLKRSYSTPLQEFWGMFMNFVNFLIWKVYPSMIIHHDQYIFMIYDMNQLARKEIIFNHLFKFCHLISIVFCKVAHQQISTCQTLFLVTIKLAPCSSWNHYSMKTGILEVLSFHMLSAWGKH